MIAPLSNEDRLQRHGEVDQYFGEDEYSCGAQWTFDGPPCGGCVDCAHTMVEHAFQQEREEADRYHAAGLEWAPGVLDWWAIVTFAGSRAEFHDGWGHVMACEDPKVKVYGCDRGQAD